MEIRTYDTVIIGSGAAGYSAASRIKGNGRKSVCIVTEGKNKGTSRNTGSDKQTYYKLGLGGSASDSVRNMASDLFLCGCTDGDNALCEAALSARCFYELCENGVPFPSNRYGEYIGYKTDHDPYARATSAGPLTSKYMTEALEKRSELLGVDVFDGLMAIEILKNADSVCGVLCVDVNTGELSVFKCSFAIMATGGPAGIYADSVYPESQSGSTGLALNAGVSLQNMTEWQYGLASLSPRWNVSGTYMQVLPRFVSMDAEGREYEFLADFFDDEYQALSMVFLKGYQWPFDIKKVACGSSVIDLLVYRETVMRHRRVYLDYTRNPFALEKIEYEKLSDEAYAYLSRADALLGRPIDRLAKMNMPAIELYAGKGVDLEKEYLEIALCAQHSNGGVSVDAWWQTTVKGLFAIGECAGTHGITRPGGSALNSGQVGALRASQRIIASNKAEISDDVFLAVLKEAEERNLSFIDSAMQNADNTDAALINIQKRMSECGAAIRNTDMMKELLTYVSEEISAFSSKYGIKDKKSVWRIYRLRDILTVQIAVLASMIEYAQNVGSSRGSALYTDRHGTLPNTLPEIFRSTFDDSKTQKDLVREVRLDGITPMITVRPVRPIPDEDEVFEKVWKGYRENQNIF